MAIHSKVETTGIVKHGGPPRRRPFTKVRLGIGIGVIAMLLFAGVATYWHYERSKARAIAEGTALAQWIEVRRSNGESISEDSINDSGQAFQWIYTELDHGFELRCYFWVFRDSLVYDSISQRWRLDKDK